LGAPALLSRTLAFDCRHGHAQQEYAIKTERGRERGEKKVITVDDKLRGV